MLRITAGARKKKGSPVCGGETSKVVTGLSINDLNQLMEDRQKWKVLVNNMGKKRKWTNV